MFTKRKLEFRMKITIAEGQSLSEVTYVTRTNSADEAIAEVFTEIAGEKMICISSPPGKTFVFPRSVLFYMECVFIREVEND